MCSNRRDVAQDISILECGRLLKGRQVQLQHLYPCTLSRFACHFLYCPAYVQLRFCKFSNYQGRENEMEHQARVVSWLALLSPSTNACKLSIKLCTHLAPLTASLLVMKTCAPFRASSRALAKPSPVLAPVTIANLPVRSGMFAADHGAMYAKRTQTAA